MRENSQKWQITHLSGRELMLITDSHKIKLIENTEDDFDACVSLGGRIDVFAALSDGSLTHIVYLEENVSSTVLLKTRNNEIGVCKIRVISVNSHIHIFYCIKRSENLLIHQVYHNGIYSQPRVIDRINDRMIYNVCSDENFDIHIVYVDSEGKTVSRCHTNSQKSYSPSRVLTESDVRFISVATCAEGVYASFAVAENNGASIYVCDVQNAKVLSAVKRVSLRTQTFLVPDEGGFVVKWSENAMCFGVRCSFDMNVSRVSVMGKSGEPVRVRAEDALCCTDAALCSPAGNVTDWEKIHIPAKKASKIVPKGYEIEELARKYTEIFSEKAKTERFFLEMQRIGLQLENIENLLKQNFDFSKDSGNGIYNNEDMEEHK